MILKSDEKLEDLKRDNLFIIQSKSKYRFSVDSVNLSTFAKVKNNDNVYLEKANALISTITELKNNLNTTLSNINSSTYNLEIYKKDFNGDPYATYWASPVPWFDDELSLDFLGFLVP